MPPPVAGGGDGVPPFTLDHDGVEPSHIVEGELHAPPERLRDELHRRYQSVGELVARARIGSVRRWSFVERGGVSVGGVHDVDGWGLDQRRLVLWWM